MNKHAYVPKCTFVDVVITQICLRKEKEGRKRRRRYGEKRETEERKAIRDGGRKKTKSRRESMGKVRVKKKKKRQSRDLWSQRCQGESQSSSSESEPGFLHVYLSSFPELSFPP